MKIPCQVELRQTYQERKNSVLEENGGNTCD